MFAKKMLACLLALLMLMGGLSCAVAMEASLTALPEQGALVEREPEEMGWSVDFGQKADGLLTQSLSSILSGGVYGDEAVSITLNLPELPRITLCLSEEGLLLHDDVTGAWSELTWLGKSINLDAIFALVDELEIDPLIQPLLRMDASGDEARQLLLEDLIMLGEMAMAEVEDFCKSPEVFLLAAKLHASHAIQLRADELNDVVNLFTERLNGFLRQFYGYEGPTDLFEQFNHPELLKELLRELTNFVLFNLNGSGTWPALPDFSFTGYMRGEAMVLRLNCDLFDLECELTETPDVLLIDGTMLLDDAAPIEIEGSIGDHSMEIGVSSKELHADLMLIIPGYEPNFTLSLTAYPIYEGYPQLDETIRLSLDVQAGYDRLILKLFEDLGMRAYSQEYIVDLGWEYDTGNIFGSFSETRIGRRITQRKKSEYSFLLENPNEDTFKLTLAQLRQGYEDEYSFTLHLTDRVPLALPEGSLRKQDVEAAMEQYFNPQPSAMLETSPVLQ